MDVNVVSNFISEDIPVEIVQKDITFILMSIHGHPTQMPGTIKPFFIEISTLVEKQKYPLVANWLTFTI